MWAKPVHKPIERQKMMPVRQHTQHQEGEPSALLIRQVGYGGSFSKMRLCGQLKQSEKTSLRISCPVCWNWRRKKRSCVFVVFKPPWNDQAKEVKGNGSEFYSMTVTIERKIGFQMEKIPPPNHNLVMETFFERIDQIFLF